MATARTADRWSTARMVVAGSLVGLVLGPLLGWLFESPLRAALAPILTPARSVIFAKAPLPIVVVPIPTFSAAPVVVTPTIPAESASPPPPQAPRAATRRAAAVPPPATRRLGGVASRGSTATVTPTSQAPRTSQVRSAAAGPSASQPRTATERVTAVSTATVTVTRTPAPTSTSADASTGETSTSAEPESSTALREVGLVGPG